MCVFQDISRSLWNHCHIIALFASSFLETPDTVGGISTLSPYILYTALHLSQSGFSFAGRAQS